MNPQCYNYLGRATTHTQGPTSMISDLLSLCLACFINFVFRNKEHQFLVLFDVVSDRSCANSAYFSQSLYRFKMQRIVSKTT